MGAQVNGTERGGRLLSIDILRGCAVLAVVLHHLPFSWSGLTDSVPAREAFIPEAREVLHFGQYGVQLFLVISGFCIHLPWARKRNLDAKLDFSTFWLRRIRRLYPPYITAVVLTIALLILGQVVIKGRLHDPLGALGYGSVVAVAVDGLFLLLLLQNLNGASWRIGNGPLWTLALEEQLYMLYFPLLGLRRRLGWPGTIAVVASITLVWRIAWYLPPGDAAMPSFWYVIGPARWLEWTLGALAVEAHLGLVQLPRWTRAPGIAIGVMTVAVALDHMGRTLSLKPIETVGDGLFGIAFFIIVNFMCRLETSNRLPNPSPVRWLSTLGVFSYSVYLVHDPLMAGVKRVLASTDSLPMIVIARLAAAIGLGYVFHRVVEQRFLSRSREVIPLPASPAVANAKA